MNLSDLITEAARLSRLIDAGIEAMRENSKQLAEAERQYRKAKAQAWLTLSRDATVPERTAVINGETADLRYQRDLAEGMRQAALEAVRARRTQVSVLQTMAKADQAEAEFARTGPR